MTTTYDLCLSWNWEHDAPFVELLDATFRAHGRTLLQVTPQNLERALSGLAAGEVAFRAYLDRSSESDPRFLPLAEWARAQAGTIRLRLLKIAAQVRVTARRIRVCYSNAYPWKPLFAAAWSALRC